MIKIAADDSQQTDELEKETKTLKLKTATAASKQFCTIDLDGST